MTSDQLAAPAAADYAAALSAAAVVALPDRDLLAVSGPQRVKFLQNILSNDVASRAVGQGCLASLLDVRGHIQALMRVLVVDDSVLLELPTTRLSDIEAALIHYRVAAPVRFALRPTAVIALVGPRSAAVLGHLGLPTPGLPCDHAAAILTGTPIRVVRAPDLPGADGEAWVVHAPREAEAAVIAAFEQAGARPIARAAFDTRRVELGRPWYGVDVDQENLLHETGLVRSHHSPTKGCYVGQEVIARLEARGSNVNKQLRGLRLSAATGAGASIAGDEGKPVGSVTTAAVSPRLGPIALGYVHRSCFDAGHAVTVAGAAATVVELPFA